METTLSTFRVHKIRTHQLHLCNSMLLWQLISKCLIIFIVQLNKDLIKRRMGCPGWDQLSLFSQMLILGLDSMDSPLVVKGTAELCDGSQPQGRGGRAWKEILFTCISTKQAFGSTGQEDSVFHLKSVSAELFSNWDPKEQLPHEHKNVQKTLLKWMALSYTYKNM